MVLKFEDAKGKCESQFDDEDAVAQCVTGERVAFQLINVWDKIDGVHKELDMIRRNQEEEMRVENLEKLR